MEELKARIGELTSAVRELGGDVEDLRKLRDDDQEQVQRVERKTARATSWILAALLGLIVFVLLMVGWNRVTLQQAQRDMTHQIVTCFLRPGDASPAQAEECARRNGGDAYRRQQRESQALLRRFADLQRWAVKNGWEPPAAKE